MRGEEYESEFRARVEETIGPTRLVPAAKMPDGRWVAGLYRVKPVWFGMRYEYGRLVGYYVAVSLKERPIECTITRRRRSGDESSPRVPTGDRAFDKQFRVTANPPEVVQAVLDEGTRRWMLMVLGDMSPQFQTSDGMLRMYSGLLDRRAAHDATPKPVPTLADLTRRIEVTLALADRMAKAFDANYEGLVRKQRKRTQRAAAGGKVRGSKSRGKTAGSRKTAFIVGALVILAVLAWAAIFATR